jgi:hypothetical protein
VKPEYVLRLAELELAGASRKEMAEALGVTPRTVSRLRHAPEVKAMTERLRSQPDSVRATTVLLDVMTSTKDERLKVDCAKAVLQYGVQRVVPEPQPAAEPPSAPPGYIVVRQERVA